MYTLVFANWISVKFSLRAVNMSLRSSVKAHLRRGGKAMVAWWCSGLAWRGARLGLAWRGGAVVWRGEVERLGLAWRGGGAVVWRGEVQGWVLIL